jgi:D-aspartate ligase
MARPIPFATVADALRDEAIRRVVQSDVPAVVLFPSSHAVAMSVIRAVEDAKIPVLALDYKPRAAGLFSRRVVPCLIPSMYDSADMFERTMLAIGAAFRVKPVLFLVDDEDLFLSLKHQELWDGVYRFPLSPWPLVEGIVDKGRLYKRLQDAAWDGCPRTWFPSSREHLDVLAPQLTYPAIIKPTYSTAFRQTFGVKARKFDSYEALRRFAVDVFEAGIEFVVQEFIPGPEDLLVTYAAYSNDKGEVVAGSTGRKIHQFPPDFGTCRLAESIRDPALERIAAEFLRLLGYRGISLTEFKRTPDGRYKVIELNPRPGDWPERLAQICGANLVLVAYHETLGQRVAPHQITRFGRKWANTPEDIYYCVRGYRLLGYPESHRGWTGWLKDIRGLAADAFFSWRDPLPAWVRLNGMVAEFRRRERALANDHRWQGATAATLKGR